MGNVLLVTMNYKTGKVKKKKKSLKTEFTSRSRGRGFSKFLSPSPALLPLIPLMKKTIKR